jgi:O-antigen/teichoic acid export membrane protein
MTLHHQEWFLLISLIPAVLAVIAHFVAIPFLGEHGFWMAIIAYVVLAVGTQELWPIH